MIQGVHHDNLAGYVANEHIDWTIDQGVTNIHNNNLGTASRFSAHLTSDQSVATETYTTAILDDEHFDGLGEYDPATGIFTATNAGYYVFNALARIELFDNSKTFMVGISEAGVPGEISLARAEITAGADDSNLALFVSVITYLEANDNVRLYVWHNHGSNRNITGSTGHYCVFSGYRL